MAYNITTLNSSSSVTLVTSDVQTIESGSSGQVVFNISESDIDKIIVEDNGVDVTSQLTTGFTIDESVENVLGAYTLISGSFNSNGASYFQGLVGKGVNSTTTTSNYYSSSSSVIAIFTYSLAFTGIPSNATVTRVYCEVNGHAESTSNSNEYMCVQLRSGSDELSSEFNFKSAGTSNTTQTLEATTIPTASQLENLVLYCRLGYYGGALNGATCYVEYNYIDPTHGRTYAIATVNSNHVVSIYEVTPPPEEDPTKTYYSLTISKANADIDHQTGTTRVESGTSEVITIYPTDPLLTLALDNGVDVSSQLVIHSKGTTAYTIDAIASASYGFSANSNNYYESQNKGVQSSAALCRVQLTLPVRCLVTIKFINYAEATYDYGIFGAVDVALGTTTSTTSDSGAKLICSTSDYNIASEQTLTYEIEEGTHFIDVKYRKDSSQDRNNDSLQFKIDSIQELEPNNYYTYELNNINQDHSLVFIFGNVTYYFVESSVNGNATLFPSGQMVQFPGDNYRLTIVPKNSGDTVTATDNGTDVTSQLERKEVTTEKSGVQTTVVNYMYRVNNIQAAHNINVNVQSSTPTGDFVGYIRKNGAWRQVQVKAKRGNSWNTVIHSYGKINNAWNDTTSMQTKFIGRIIEI